MRLLLALLMRRVLLVYSGAGGVVREVGIVAAVAVCWVGSGGVMVVVGGDVGAGGAATLARKGGLGSRVV